MDPVKLLFHEHDIIVSVIDSAKKIAASAGNDGERFENLARQLLGFFRQYADSYHHNKEELILFPEMEKENELLGDGVIKEMLENHEDFREMLRSIEQNLDRKNYSEAGEALDQYCEALLDHIAVENDEVFQVAESLFSTEDLEKMYFRFVDLDRETGDDEKHRLEDLANEIIKEAEFAE